MPASIALASAMATRVATLPVYLFTARKLGALGAGMTLCPSSTPLPVTTNTMSPSIAGEHADMLCGKTPNSLIMSSFQTTSPSILSVSFSAVNGPSFLPS